MIDIESRLVESLHADATAGPPVDTASLRAGAIARARTIRTRRRALGAFAVAGLVAVIGGGAVAAIRPDSGGQVWDSAGRGTTLPPAVDAPPAGERPDAVGTDPAVLHFDVDFAALGKVIPGVVASEWFSTKGYETVQITGASWSDTKVQVSIAPGEDVFERVRTRDWVGRRLRPQRPVHVDDPVEPTVKVLRFRTTPKSGLADGASDGAEKANWDVVWQLPNGLHVSVKVFDVDRALALTVADTVRFDRAQRCAVPLRLADLPAGATWTGCRSAVRHQPVAERGVWRFSQILLGLPAGGQVSVWAEEDRKVWYPTHVPEFTPNRTVAGRPAQWMPSRGPGLWLLGYGPAELFVSGVAEPDAVRLVEGLELADDLARPESWPHRPVG